MAKLCCYSNTNLIQVLQHLRRIFINTVSSSLFEFFLAITAGEQTHPEGASPPGGETQTLSPTTTEALISTPNRSAAVRKRSGFGLAYWT